VTPTQKRASLPPTSSSTGTLIRYGGVAEEPASSPVVSVSLFASSSATTFGSVVPGE
jgi:hypothetical protein